MWRRLQGSDESLTRKVALQSTEFFGGDNDDCVSSMDRHMLRSLPSHTPHQLAEASFGIL
jgi:hypothetical protein